MNDKFLVKTTKWRYGIMLCQACITIRQSEKEILDIVRPAYGACYDCLSKEVKQRFKPLVVPSFVTHAGLRDVMRSRFEFMTTTRTIGDEDRKYYMILLAQLNSLADGNQIDVWTEIKY